MILINMSYSYVKDKTKGKQKVVNHSKFWSAELDPNDDKIVIVRWGRIGTKGQSQTKTFRAPYDAQCFITRKSHEKRCDGYGGADAYRLDLLNKIAEAIGSANKITDYNWVKKHGSRYMTVNEDTLMDPGYEPTISASVESRRLGSLKLIFTATECLCDRGDGYIPIEDKDINEFATKVHAALIEAMLGE